MKIKVFTANHNGKIEFTPEALEKLLTDTYEEGQRDCNCGKITWTNPYVGPYVNCNTANNATIEDHANTAIDNFKAESVCACNPERRAFVVDMKINDNDLKNLANALDTVVKTGTLFDPKADDVFGVLAKELNF